MSHNYTDRTFTSEKGLVEIVGVVNVGAAGALTFQQFNGSTRAYSSAALAPALGNGFRGIKSVTRLSTGKWVVALDQPFVRIVNAQAVSQVAGGLAAAPIMSIDTTNTNVNSQSAPQVGLQFVNNSGVATDPASGEQILLLLVLQMSTAA